MNMKKTLIATAITAAVGLPASQAMAAPGDQIMTMSWDGAFTILEPGGVTALYNSAAGSHVAPYWGYRTAITGTMTFNLDHGSGTGTVAGFSFFGGGLAEATTITFQAIGNGFGGPGSLVIGNMGFNWSGNNGIPVSLVMDAAGLFGYLGGFDPNNNPSDGITSDTLSGFGALAATETFSWDGGAGVGTFSLPMGPSPIVTTTWNTTAIGTTVLGDNPSGTTPIVTDTIGGNPMATAPFVGHYANFDVTTLHITSFDPGAVPVPAAVWLFGSGLIGLVGVARRRKKTV